MSDSRRSASPAQVARSIQRTVAIAVAIAGQAMYRWLLASMLFGRLRTDPQDGRDLPTGSAGGRAAPVGPYPRRDGWSSPSGSRGARLIVAA